MNPEPKSPQSPTASELKTLEQAVEGVPVNGPRQMLVEGLQQAGLIRVSGTTAFLTKAGWWVVDLCRTAIAMAPDGYRIAISGGRYQATVDGPTIDEAGGAREWKGPVRGNAAHATGDAIEHRWRAMGGIPPAISPEELKRRLDDLGDRYRKLEAKHEDLMNSIRAERAGDRWVWTGDPNEDDIGSLSGGCAVLIKARDLRELMSCGPDAEPPEPGEDEPDEAKPDVVVDWNEESTPSVWIGGWHGLEVEDLREIVTQGRRMLASYDTAPKGIVPLRNGDIPGANTEYRDDLRVLHRRGSGGWWLFGHEIERSLLERIDREIGEELSTEYGKDEPEPAEGSGLEQKHGSKLSVTSDPENPPDPPTPADAAPSACPDPAQVLGGVAADLFYPPGAPTEPPPPNVTVRMVEESLDASPNAPEPPPKPGTGPAIWELVVADMQERDQVGEQKYGQRLQAGDGRSSLVDAYQEALDLAVYLRKEIAERDAKREERQRIAKEHTKRKGEQE